MRSTILIFALSASMAQASIRPVNPWSAVKTPASGPAESIGSPSAGCLKGAVKLERTGPGFALLKPGRGRMYGHPRLVALLREVGQSFQKSKASPLLIGDLGLPRGGPTMSAHASHQTGLDVDLSYSRNLRTPNLVVVDSGQDRVNRRFGPAQVELLKTLAEKDATDRILVHYAVKRELCEHHASEPWIRKLRPWFGHADHLHLRLKCAPTDTKCKDGETIPSGNGCDPSLAWWWSEEAKEEAKKNLAKREHPVMPDLPAECQALVVPRGSRTVNVDPRPNSLSSLIFP